MGKYKFDEVLNDLMDYFILGDPDYLLQYKVEQHLPDDLLTEFTTNESGDRAVEQGVMIPMIGVENYPYTVYFTMGETPELLKAGNDLQHRCDGYSLRVQNGRIYLYTIPYLKEYTEAKVVALKKYKQATIALENGWYTVSILAGLTKQTPTFEFLLTPSAEQPVYSGDFLYRFRVESL